MQQRLLLALGLGFAVLYLSAYSIGPTSSAGDKTGSPLTNGQTCGGCHQGGDYDPTTTLTLLDGTGEEVSDYVPGQRYTLRVSIAAENDPAAYGLQAVILDTATASAGVFGDVPEDLKVTTASNGRDYVEHRRKLPAASYDIPWTAPEVGVGEVTVYAAGNAVNSNGGTSGDNVAEAQLTIAEASTSATVRALPSRAWRAYQRTDGELILEVPAADPADGLWFSVVDDAGRGLASGALSTGLTRIPLPVPTKLVTVAVVDGAGRTSSRRILVR